MPRRGPGYCAPALVLRRLPDMRLISRGRQRFAFGVIVSYDHLSEVSPNSRGVIRMSTTSDRMIVEANTECHPPCRQLARSGDNHRTYRHIGMSMRRTFRFLVPARGRHLERVQLAPELNGWPPRTRTNARRSAGGGGGGGWPDAESRRVANGGTQGLLRLAPTCESHGQRTVALSVYKARRHVSEKRRTA